MRSLQKGNDIFAIHINGIKGKDEKTKNNGNNPLYYLGYSFDKTGEKLSLHNYIQNKWIAYSDLDGWTVNQVTENSKNKIFRLSSIYSIYDWVKDDGYNNFATWVG